MAEAASPVSLTIAIPTFERCATVTTTVDQFRDACRGLPVEVLVADNHSSDGTVQALRRKEEDTRSDVPLTTIAGEVNLGILGNFYRLVEHCTTSHLLLLSDEEGPVDPSVYRDLLDRVEQRRDSVLVPSPSRDAGGALDRSIAPEELWGATNYLSGIVYPVAPLRKAVEVVRGVGKRGDIAGIWNLWPFYVVIVEMMLQGHDCRWIPEDLYV